MATGSASTVIALGILLLGCIVSMQLNLLKNVPAPTKFFSVSKMGKVMKLAPLHYPESLQGVIWMDQAGAYGHSDLPKAMPDLSVAFGDPSTPLDRESRTQNVNIVGPGWSWANNAIAYNHFNRDIVEQIEVGGHFYRFEWNEDYSAAEIFMCTSTCSYKPLIASLSFLVGLGVYMKTPLQQGNCPPSPNASKQEVSACAVFDRLTTIKFRLPFVGWVTVPFIRYHYPVFKVMNGHGKPIEPYHSAFLKYVAKNYKPDVAQAKEYNITLEMGNMFIGTEGCPNCATTLMSHGISSDLPLLQANAEWPWWWR